ncbi:MAG TPA: hypothetical protein VJ617_00605 [Arthrobacter sp.]|nr:hypothetical protein [Arthrobacter sp.]
MTDEPSGHGRSFAGAWRRHSRIGKVALGLDLALLAFPLWILPSWYLITFLIGAGGGFESPRAIAANSVFQGVLVLVVLVVNLVAIVVGKDHSRVLGLAVILLIGVLAYMGWYMGEYGFPGSGYR